MSDGHQLPKPYTGPWEEENPELAQRIWQCLTKRFHDYEDLIKRSAVYCESPIEEDLLAALLTEDSAFYYEGDPILIPPGQAFPPPDPDNSPASRFLVAPQFKVGAYRVDIACAFTWTGKRLAVECDGHDFHHATKEQVTADNERSRALLASGWPTMRFSGSEIHKDPFGCAAQVARFLAADEPYSSSQFVVGARR
jgi:very-short-patch-repair endonuclease